MQDPLGDDDHTDRAERERVIAWLRKYAERPSGNYLGTSPRALADMIERGEHWTDGSVPPTPVERFFDGDTECEEHSGVAWPHDNCAGPGMPWRNP
jgi:hypothetical protein